MRALQNLQDEQQSLMGKCDKLVAQVDDWMRIRSLADGYQMSRILMNQNGGLNNLKEYSANHLAVKRPGEFDGGEMESSSKRGRPN